MKKLHSKKLNKFIVSIVVAVMLCGFIMPPISYAETDTNSGGGLFAPIVKLVVYICDNIFQFFQDSFVNLNSIQNRDGTFTFDYSPAAIFSGKIPAFDINFINPKPGYMATDLSYALDDRIDYWRKTLYDLYLDNQLNIEDYGTAAKRKKTYR